MSAAVRNVENSWQDKQPFVKRFFGGCSGRKERRRQIGSAPFRSLRCLKSNQFPEFLRGKKGKEKSI